MFKSREYDLEEGDPVGIKEILSGHIWVQTELTILNKVTIKDGIPGLVLGKKIREGYHPYIVPEAIVQEGGVCEGLGGVTWLFPNRANYEQYLKDTRSRKSVMIRAGYALIKLMGKRLAGGIRVSML